MKSLLIVLLLLTNCNYREKQTEADKVPNSGIIKLVIEFTNNNDEMIYKITCDEFDKKFGDIHSKVIKDTASLNSFGRFLTKLPVDPNKYQPDVRIKIIIYKRSGNNAILCTDGLNAGSLNGTAVIIDDKFKNFIAKLKSN